MARPYRYRLLILFLLAAFVPDLRAQTGLALLQRADSLVSLHRSEKAEAIYREVSQSPPDEDALLWAITGLLHIADFRSELSAADSLIREGDALLGRSGNISFIRRLKFLQQKAEALRGMSRYDEALHLHRQVLNQSRNAGDRELTSYAYLYTSTTLEQLTRFDEALIYGDSALQSFTVWLESDDARWASIYNIFAVNHQRVSDLDQAEMWYLKAVDVLESTGGDTSAMLSMVYNNLSGIYSNRGQYRKAIEITQRSERINQIIDDRSGLSFNYYALGVYYYYLGDWGRCKDYMEACVRIREEVYGPDHYRLAAPLEVLGIAYEAFRDFDQNIYYLKKSLVIKKQVLGSDNLQVGFSYENIALGYLESGNVDSAYTYILKANRILRREIDPTVFQWATHLHTLAGIYLKVGRTDEALKIADESIVVLNQLGLEHSPDYALHLNLRASILQKLGRDSEAGADLRRGLQLLKNPTAADSRFLVTENSLSLLDNYIGFLYKRYQATGDQRLLDSLQMYVGHSQQVIDDFKRQTNDPYTKVAVAARASDLYHQNVSIFSELYRQRPGTATAEYIFRLAERNRATLFRQLIDDYKIDRFSGIPEIDLQKEDSLKSAISELRAHFLEAEVSDSVRDLLFRANEELYALIAYYTEHYPRYYDLKFNDDAPGLADVRRNLISDKHTFVEFYETDTAFYAIIIGAEQADVRYLAGSHEVESAVTEWKTALMKQSEETEPAGRHLYNLIWKPMAGLVSERVTVIPSGILFYVSLEALSDTTGNYLIERHTFSYGLSATVLLHQRETAAPSRKSAYIIAPGFESDLKDKYRQQLPEREPVDERYLKTVRQPWSVRMAQQLAKRLRIRPMIGEAATETAVREQLQESSIVHFATHAVADEQDPLRSHLVLAKDIGQQKNDGYLYAYELFDLPVHAELAVLSACESGVGHLQDGEGMISLAYSMHYAGCPGVVMSLWEIDERTNAWILEDFYDHLGDGLPKSEALQRAKLDYIYSHEGPLAHPYYWSGLVMMGNDTPLATSLRRPVGWRYIAFLLIGLMAVVLLLLRKSRR